jgi:endo-1,4-beta-D-glucanase Y
MRWRVRRSIDVMNQQRAAARGLSILLLAACGSGTVAPTPVVDGPAGSGGTSGASTGGVGGSGGATGGSAGGGKGGAGTGGATGGSASGGKGGAGTGGATGGSASGGKGGAGTGGATGGTGGASGGGAGATFEPRSGERYPFPQNVRYAHGVQSTKITNQHVYDWYEAWKAKYLQQCNGNLRPGVDPLDQSFVEAQGFAMIAAAYMGDRSVVDGLQAFYLSKRTSQGCGLMGWKATCSGFIDQGSATDGDIDVASGLLVAHWQWPDGGYGEQAKAILSNLKRVIASCSGKSALHPGCAGGNPWGGCNETDISYYSPAFFREFAKLTGDSGWTKLADDTHAIRDAAANASTGLVPDWQSVSGTAGAGSRKGYFSFDAIRVPYKHALDYLWNGNQPTLAWATKITTWAHGVGVANLKDEYQLNGTVQGQNHNLAVVGSLAVAAMANTPEVLDAFATESAKLKDDFWYSGYLGNLYLLALSGNLWNPELAEAPR